MAEQLEIKINNKKLETTSLRSLGLSLVEIVISCIGLQNMKIPKLVKWEQYKLIYSIPSMNPARMNGL